ncbi:HEAT repeat domain-containing protein [Actinoplanes utahensis]|uniref:HEAT repeat domain-containing protein n=1 Tax=Actinoplanes utahensis TaxID=1869 RepID=UPI001269EFC2|nr:HEAT repeat domain-containing protein [Actinoplanes utahensis]GIF32739.1 hypothetical protein Aut01nite_57250 [Actinoplanes utahensis]
MLERLDEVPWAELTHAYGSAADVPEQIRALGSPDPAVRKQAYHDSYGNIFHQGTRYQATAFAVPFLIELLADPSTPDRAGLLDLLAALAVSYDESLLPHPFPIADLRRRAAGGEAVLAGKPLPTGEEDDSGDYEYQDSLEEDDQERMYAYIDLCAYQAVQAGVPLYRQLLADPDPAVRTAAAYAVAWFPEDAAGSIGPLTVAATDPSDTVAASALVALGLLGAADAGSPAALRAAVAGARELPRWGAAVALAALHGPDTEPAAVAELHTWAAGDHRARRGIPYLEGDLSGYAALALRQLGDAHAGTAFDTLLTRIPSVDGPAAMPVVKEALRHAFPAGRVAAGTRFADLTDRQQRLVRALAASPSTWQWGDFGSFGNFMGMVGGYGLPTTAEDMAAFAAGGRSS